MVRFEALCFICIGCLLKVRSFLNVGSSLFLSKKGVGISLRSASAIEAAGAARTVENEDFLVDTMRQRGVAEKEQCCVDSLKRIYENIPEDFLATIPRKQLIQDESDLVQRIELAKTLSRMATLVLVMRGENVIAKNFKYYSPCTGLLDKDEFLGLLRTIDIAFPEFALYPDNFRVYGDGMVSFEASYRSSFEGPLNVKGSRIDPNFKTAISNVELFVVDFDSYGLLQSMSAGIVVAEAIEYKDPKALEKIEQLEQKIESSKLKVQSLAGQEQTIAYQKSVEEITNLEMDLADCRDEVDIMANTGKSGGYEGLFYAVGLQWNGVEELIGVAPHKFVDGMHRRSISMPRNIEIDNIPTFGSEE